MSSRNLTGGDVSRDAMRDSLTANGLMPRFEWLRADTLKSPEYQRPLKLGKARKIARELDPDKFWPLIVSRRTDGDYVLDGQHRLHAVRDILNWRDQNVPCEVYDGLTVEMEAKLYATQAADSRSPISPLERLHADLIAGVPDAVGLTVTVKRAGLAMDWTAGAAEGTIRAAVALRRIYKVHGPALLLETLLLLRDTFGRDARVYQSDMLNGVVAFVLRYQDHQYYARAEFVRKIGRVGLDAVLQRARTIAAGYSGSTSGGTIHVGRALLVHYNHDRRTHRLPDWQDRIPLPPAAAQQAAERISETNKRQFESGVRPTSGAVGAATERATERRAQAAD